MGDKVDITPAFLLPNFVVLNLGWVVLEVQVPFFLIHIDGETNPWSPSWQSSVLATTQSRLSLTLFWHIYETRQCRHCCVYFVPYFSTRNPSNQYYTVLTKGWTGGKIEGKCIQIVATLTCGTAVESAVHSSGTTQEEL